MRAYRAGNEAPVASSRSLSRVGMSLGETGESLYPIAVAVSAVQTPC